MFYTLFLLFTAILKAGEAACSINDHLDRYRAERILDESYPTIVNQTSSYGGSAYKLQIIDHELAKVPNLAVFNPAIIEHHNKLYIALRTEDYFNRPKAFYRSRIYIGELEGTVVKNIQLLVQDINNPNEDPRLSTIDGNLFLSFVSDLRRQIKGHTSTKYIPAMKCAEIPRNMRVDKAVLPNILNNATPQSRQKNWLFFQGNDQKKWIIVDLDPMNVWDATSSLSNPSKKIQKERIMTDWEYGTIRSSTTPIFIEEVGLYLVVFHSFLPPENKQGRVYFVGHCFFNSNFDIVAYSKKPILMPQFYPEPPLKHRTVLPYAAIRRDDFITLSCGVNDREAWLVNLPLRVFLGYGKINTHISDQYAYRFKNLLESLKENQQKKDQDLQQQSFTVSLAKLNNQVRALTTELNNTTKQKGQIERRLQQINEQLFSMKEESQQEKMCELERKKHSFEIKIRNYNRTIAAAIEAMSHKDAEIRKFNVKIKELRGG